MWEESSKQTSRKINSPGSLSVLASFGTPGWANTIKLLSWSNWRLLIWWSGAPLCYLQQQFLTLHNTSEPLYLCVITVTLSSHFQIKIHCYEYSLPTDLDIAVMKGHSIVYSISVIMFLCCWCLVFTSILGDLCKHCDAMTVTQLSGGQAIKRFQFGTGALFPNGDGNSTCYLSWLHSKLPRLRKIALPEQCCGPPAWTSTSLHCILPSSSVCVSMCGFLKSIP